jgi:hypothetical protein
MGIKTNIFSNLFKYKSSEITSPLENFTTEALAFILKLSVETDTIFFRNFLSVIDETIEFEDNDTIKIETQRRFTSIINNSKLEAIPDITISINNNYLFIEVKVGSILNEELRSEEDKQYILNQLVKYKNIELVSNEIKNKKICTLTIINEKKDVGFEYFAINWSQVSCLMDNYKTKDVTFKSLINEFSNFLKSENMAIDKVEKSIIGASNLTILLNQIKSALIKLNLKPSFSSGESYSGYYIEDKDYGIKLWIGYGYKTFSIKIQIVNKSLIDYTKEIKKYEIDSDSKKYILISNLLNVYNDYFELDSGKQYELLVKWLELNITEVQKIVKSSNMKFTLDF